MSQSRARTFDSSEFKRSLPVMLGALLLVVFAVDVLLAFQPALLDEWSRAFRGALSLHPVVSPWLNVLAAALAVAAVVTASAVLLAFVRATLAAPQLSIAPVWVALCTLTLTRAHAPLPIPISTTLFVGLSALLFVGGAISLRAGSRTATLLGWSSLALPMVVFGASYIDPPAALSFGREAGWLLAGLVLSATGAVLAAYMPTGRGRSRNLPELDGVDVVDALFTQVERAEQAEARVAELERQLYVVARRS